MSEHFVVVTAIVNFKGKILILKRNKSMEMHPNKWSFPGGKVLKGEDLFTALKREIKEETNLDIENEKQFISDFAFIRPSGISTIGFCFLVNAKNNNVELSQEFTDFAWVAQKEIKDYDLIQSLNEELLKAFSHLHKSF